MRQKKLAHTTLAKLKRQCESAWKAACLRRDKQACQLCHTSKREFPNLVLQVDHCFSRRMQEIHYDHRNGTTLCKGCHTRKTFNVGGADYALYKLVERREGEAVMMEMQGKNKVKKWTALELENQMFHLDSLFQIP